MQILNARFIWLTAVGAVVFTTTPAYAVKVQTSEGTGEIVTIQGKTLQIPGLANRSSNTNGVTRSMRSLIADLDGKETSTNITIDLSADVLFDFDSATLRPAATPKLRKIAALIAQYPKSAVLIEGHTDSKGADDYNMTLSRNRADSVRAWFSSEGKTSATRIQATGVGETRPIASNTKPNGEDNPAGRQKNRRVEITIQKNG
jgi:outer membrane protein OmpA-like peptidoglycan-associated protein